jgi:hypothetical protein
LAATGSRPVRLLNHRKQRLLGAPARLKDAREGAALADLGDLQLDLARPGVTGEIRRIVLTRGRLLLLGKGAVLAHRFDRPLAAESDEYEQRPTRDAGRRAAAPASRYR